MRNVGYDRDMHGVQYVMIKARRVLKNIISKVAAYKACGPERALHDCDHLNDTQDLMEAEPRLLKGLPSGGRFETLI